MEAPESPEAKWWSWACEVDRGRILGRKSVLPLVKKNLLLRRIRWGNREIAGGNEGVAMGAERLAEQ